MKIGLIIDTFNIGGAETMVFETSKLLKGHGVTPVLLHFGSPYVVEFCEKENIEQHKIPNRHLYKKTLLLPLFALRTRSFIKKLKLDCLHAHLFGPIVAFAPLAWMIKLPFTGTLHDVYMLEGAPHRAALLKLATIFKTQLTTVSKPMRQFYLENLKCNQDTITYIPNCTQVNTNTGKRLTVRKSLNVKDNDVVIITVGRLVELKRFDIFIDAIEQLSEAYCIKAFIVGDGPERHALENKISRHGLRDRINMLGERNNVEELLVASDIFTLTSETEGMSKSILEALAASLPVIATNVGGNKDLVTHGENGFIMEDHSPKTLKNYLERLVLNEKFRLQMGSKSLDLVNSEYNSEKFLKRHLDLYSKTIERR